MFLSLLDCTAISGRKELGIVFECSVFTPALFCLGFLPLLLFAIFPIVVGLGETFIPLPPAPRRSITHLGRDFRIFSWHSTRTRHVSYRTCSPIKLECRLISVRSSCQTKQNTSQKAPRPGRGNNCKSTERPRSCCCVLERVEERQSDASILHLFCLLSSVVHVLLPRSAHSSSPPTLNETGTLPQDARRRPVQPRLHDLSAGVRSLHIGPTRLRREVQLRDSPKNDHHPPTASRSVCGYCTCCLACDESPLVSTVDDPEASTGSKWGFSVT